ncbi:MAG: TIGR03000 domain-containing protein [Gemmataceae bacterium]|nr:TIGR03000 domain-containing protein [Gemmataceae bacterium]
MYSVVLAAMLTTAPATPQWHHGCHGCHGCWSSCHGCYSCYGCWGCYGCSGCWGGYGWGGWGGYYYGAPYAVATYPAYWGGWGAFGCAGGAYACVGCYGCYGWGGGYYAAAPVLPSREPAMPAADAVKMAGRAAPATVVVQAPAEAKVFVEGRAVALDARGSFTTPKLEAGEGYVYTIKVQTMRDGRPVTETKDVSVRAGETSRVAFDKLAGNAPAVAGNGEPAPARITVKLPESARLYINDVLCPLTSATRSFDTPRLDPDKDYTYTLRVELGQAKSETKQIRFRAGQPVNVEFGADTRTAGR